MAFQVEWTDPAWENLKTIVNQIREDNPAAAERFADELLERTDRLSQFPRSTAVYVRRRGFEVRQFSYGNYRVFYRVRPRLQRVEILTVRHGARREPRLR